MCLQTINKVFQYEGNQVFVQINFFSFHTSYKIFPFSIMGSISRQHFISVYEWDLGIDRFAPGLKRMPKITEEHVNLNPALRMRVYLVAQVKRKCFRNLCLTFYSTVSQTKYVTFKLDYSDFLRSCWMILSWQRKLTQFQKYHAYYAFLKVYSAAAHFRLMFLFYNARK